MACAVKFRENAYPLVHCTVELSEFIITYTNMSDTSSLLSSKISMLPMRETVSLMCNQGDAALPVDTTRITL